MQHSCAYYQDQKKFNIYALFLHIINKIKTKTGLIVHSILSDLAIDKYINNKKAINKLTTIF